MGGERESCRLRKKLKCAAAELELRENIKELDLISEYNLSKEPIRIDLLVIKESEQERILKILKSF